ncbi:MAG: hypothetical protein V5A45_15705 [Haloarculaceae archaeon]
MRRRQVLAALPAVALTGCLSGDSDTGNPTPAEQTPPDGVEFVEFTHSDPIRAGREARFGAVLRNTTDTDQYGTAALELSPAGTDWRQLVKTEYELGPAEQISIETTAVTHFVGSLQLRLVPRNRTTRVEVGDQPLDYGATYELPSGIHLTVEAPRRIDAYEYETDGQRRTAIPPDGTYWDRVTVTAENRGGESAIAPYRTAFETLGYDWREAIPCRAENTYGGGNIQPGSSQTGNLLFETRHQLVEKSIRLRHPHENGIVGATWSSATEVEEE